MKYYVEYDNGMIIKQYDESKGIRQIGNRYFIYSNTIIVNDLHDSVEAAIKSLGGYSKPVIIPGNKEIIPEAINYPNYFEANCNAIGLYMWNPNIIETVANR